MDALQDVRDEMSTAELAIRAAQAASKQGAASPEIVKAYYALQSDKERAAFVAVLASRLDTLALRYH